MAMFNKRDEFGWMAVALHWLLFLLILGLFVGGKYSDSLSSSAKNPLVIGIHKQLGLAVFILMVFRLLWRLINTTPQAINTNVILRLLAFLNHWLLYFAVLFQAFAGVAMTQMSGRVVELFGVFQLPSVAGAGRFIVENLETLLALEGSPARQMRGIHELGATVILVLLALHVLGALAHHTVFQDDTLRRMSFGYRPAYAKKRQGGL